MNYIQLIMNNIVHFSVNQQHYTFVASEILAWVCALAILYYHYMYLYMFITYSIMIKCCRCSWSRAVKHRCCKSIFNSSIIAYDATRGIYTLEITIINCMLHREWMYAYIHIYIPIQKVETCRGQKSLERNLTSLSLKTCGTTPTDENCLFHALTYQLRVNNLGRFRHACTTVQPYLWLPEGKSYFGIIAIIHMTLLPAWMFIYLFYIAGWWHWTHCSPAPLYNH